MKRKNIVVAVSILLFTFIGGLLIFYNKLSDKYNYKNLNNNYIDFNDETIDEDLINRFKTQYTNFVVYNEEENEVSLLDFKGVKPVVINFWASWCTPCKEEMKVFKDVIEKYKDDNIEFLMVNQTGDIHESYDYNEHEAGNEFETKEKAKNFLKENNLDMDILYDLDLSATKSYKVFSLPRTIFITKDGEIINDHKGIIDEKTLNDIVYNLIHNL